MKYEILPGIYELSDINNSFQESLELKADEKIMKIISTTHHLVIFNSELNEILGITKKNYPAGTHFSRKPTNITNIDKVHLKCYCINGSIVNGRRESIFSPSFSAAAGFETCKEPTLISLRKVDKKKVDNITFYLEDDDKVVDFNGETFTFTVMLFEV